MANLYGDFSDAAKQAIDVVRAEAIHVKDCFMRFAFQALVFSAIMFGLIVRFQVRVPETAYASVLIIVLLLAVARIGTYKYGTANRNLAYELHLYRSSRIARSAQHGWKVDISDVGWEEAMRAWRVVQATLFSYLYHTEWYRTNKLRKRFDGITFRWFEPETMLPAGTEYYAGSFLRNMLSILHTMSAISLLPLLFMIWQVWDRRAGANFFPYDFALATLIFLGVSTMVVFRIAQDRQRRRLLEGGFLSIHSSSIMWHAVIVAHFCALEETFAQNSDQGLGYKHYTRNLAGQAERLKTSIFEVHEWVRSMWR